MKIKILSIMFFCLFSGYSQENQKIDSLNREILKLEAQIKEIKVKVKDEIIENGYLILAKSKYTFSPLVIKKKAFGQTMDTIPDNSILKIIDKKYHYFKVEFNGVIGFIDYYKLKNEGSIPFSLIEDAFITSIGRKINKSYTRKTLDYSKPVKVRGHYRRTKSGKRVWVRSHTRKN